MADSTCFGPPSDVYTGSVGLVSLPFSKEKIYDEADDCLSW